VGGWVRSQLENSNSLVFRLEEAKQKRGLINYSCRNNLVKSLGLPEVDARVIITMFCLCVCQPKTQRKGKGIGTGGSLAQNM